MQKIIIITNGLEKYMTFAANKNLAFNVIYEFWFKCIS